MLDYLVFNGEISDFFEFLRESAKKDKFDMFEEWLIDKWAEYQEKVEETIIKI